MLKSAYEIAREERIRRNNEILRQMEIESLGENVAAKENKEKNVTKTKKKRKTTKPKILPQRRSKRLKGEKADVVDTAVVTAQKPTRRVHHASYVVSCFALEHHTRTPTLEHTGTRRNSWTSTNV